MHARWLKLPTCVIKDKSAIEQPCHVYDSVNVAEAEAETEISPWREGFPRKARVKAHIRLPNRWNNGIKHPNLHHFPFLYLFVYYEVPF